jgi:hypothetical protein
MRGSGRAVRRRALVGVALAAAALAAAGAYTGREVRGGGAAYGPRKTISLSVYPRPSSPLTVCKGTVLELKATLSDGAYDEKIEFFAVGASESFEGQEPFATERSDHDGEATTFFDTRSPPAAGSHIPGRIRVKATSEGYSGSNEVEVTVCQLGTRRVVGNNPQGQASVTARMRPSQSMSQARLLVRGHSHSSAGPLSAGVFDLSLDQNALSFTTATNLRTEADIPGATCSHSFTATPSRSTRSDSETLTFYFIGEGLGLIIFPSRLDAISVAFDWSVASSGLTSVVPDQYPYDDAAFVLMNCVYALQKGNTCSVLGTMNWTPSGPSVAMGAGRFTYLIGADDRYVAAEPGTNWWFQPGQGKGTATMGVIIGTDAGLVPGTPINNDLEVSFP